ncbi:MAG: multiheme c-type cytochrome [Proteobacteria bacterium]|nr:multiheme c-type cytochrome [Pseudomonadota bacterium]
MAICRNKLNMTGTQFHANLIIAARLALVALVFSVTSLTAGAAGSSPATLTSQDQQCLGCHSVKGLEKKLANGETLSLHVPGQAFAQSVHNMIGCDVCHRNITLENHPPIKTKIASLRENSLELTKVCRSCHREIFKLYDGSIHAVQVRDGNEGAPICTDCHSPHTVMRNASFIAATGAPCSNCHITIYKAYSGSVHGQATLACSSCHRAHDVSAATKEDRLRSACLGCHDGALESHKTWLPNAARHFDAVSCPACHSPAAKRKVDLKLYDNATQQRVAEKEGVPQFVSRARSADAKGAGLDEMALQNLLHEFNPDGIDNKTTLRGRLEVSTGVEAHQLASSTQAIRDCAKCHQQGADPFQSVTVSIVGPDGRPVRYAAQKEVLNSMKSVDSVGGFYAIGGTRIKLLDWLLVLSLLGGVAVPIGHLTLTWFFRRSTKKISGQEIPEAPVPQVCPSSLLVPLTPQPKVQGTTQCKESMFTPSPSGSGTGSTRSDS